ncbi:MAG TPA: beta-ketoacyl-ACP reductase [Anaerolineales bacterium]
MRLKNKTAIITGGANGIGRATAERFAAEGAAVSIWDMDDESGETTQSEITSAGGHALYQHVDVANAEHVQKSIDQLLESWNHIDILINNAGILRDAQLVKFKEGQVISRMSLEDFDAVINVNLRGVFVCARAVTPTMIRQGYGRIINASSVVGLYGNFGQTNYVATKTGVIGMTRVWARELGRYGITVNAVAPGFIGTEMVRQMPEKILNAMISRTPLGRLGAPEDIANAYLYLASDEASFVTGTVLSVDGGQVVGT